MPEESTTPQSAESVVRLSITLTNRELQIIEIYRRTYGLNRSAALRAILNSFAAAYAHGA
jgi:hypothetical protein